MEITLKELVNQMSGVGIEIKFDTVDENFYMKDEWSLSNKDWECIYHYFPAKINLMITRMLEKRLTKKEVAIITAGTENLLTYEEKDNVK